MTLPWHDRRLQQSAFTIVGRATIQSDSAAIIPAGSNYIETTKVYKRPIDVTVDMRQSDGLNAECGVISVFPTSSGRHSGYNAGLGWWRSHFGAGSPGPAARGNTNGAVSNWHTIRISVLANGIVHYYLDGILRHTDNDMKYTSGKIRLGNNCREFAYKNLKVTENASDDVFTIVGRATIQSDSAAIIPA